MTNDSTNLKGNQRIVFRQMLKASKSVVFVDDVCNFTDLNPSQVRSAFTGLIKKGLAINLQPHPVKTNIYSLAY